MSAPEHVHPGPRVTPPAKRSEQPDRQLVAGLSSTKLLERYAVGVENFDRRVFSLNDEQLDMAFLPDAKVGRWPVRVLVGHCADAELSFVHRLRRTAAEDGPVLGAWDENAFIDRGLYGQATPLAPKGLPIAGAVATIHTLRQWTGEWLRHALALEGEGLMQRPAMHTELGPMMLRDILVYSVWHIEHHGWYLNRKVERFLGPAEGH